MIYSTWKFLYINVTPQESTPHKHYATLYSINSGNAITGQSLTVKIFDQHVILTKILIFKKF